MVTGKTKTGFEFCYSQDAINDMRTFRALAELQSGNVMSAEYLGKKLLGEKKYAELLAHIETEDGRQPVDALVAEINDIFLAAQNAKK